MQCDRLVASADGERGLLEGRLGHNGADAVRQRIALCRQAEEVRVQMVVAVLVVEGADRVSAGREIVESDGHRPGARPNLFLRVGLIALEELGRARIEPDENSALGAFQAIDRDDDACGRGLAGHKDQRNRESKEQDSTTHAGIAPLNQGSCLNKRCDGDAQRTSSPVDLSAISKMSRWVWSAAIGRMKQVDGFSLSQMGQNFEACAK